MVRGKGCEIHLYDSSTGAFVQTYPSQTRLEADLGLYRGKSSEILLGQIPQSILISREKADIFPGFNKEAQPIITPKVTKPISITMLSESDLRKKHDMFFMIISFIKSIPDGSYVEEPVMLRQLGLIGKPRYREALSRAELKDYKGRVDGVTYYGSSSSIRKLKSEGIIQ